MAELPKFSRHLGKVEIRPVRTCAMHPAIIIGTVRSLWTWLWGRYHVPQNAFLVLYNNERNSLSFQPILRDFKVIVIYCKKLLTIKYRQFS